MSHSIGKLKQPNPKIKNIIFTIEPRGLQAKMYNISQQVNIFIHEPDMPKMKS